MVGHCHLPALAPGVVVLGEQLDGANIKLDILVDVLSTLDQNFPERFFLSLGICVGDIEMNRPGLSRSSYLRKVNLACADCCLPDWLLRLPGILALDRLGI